MSTESVRPITCVACLATFQTQRAAARHWQAQHDTDARIARLERENAALRAALERLVQAADRLATEEHYSIASFVCGVELAAARRAGG
jgi:type II secretory pathway component PulJ